MISGLRSEARKLLDFYFERADLEIPKVDFPLGRKERATQMPILYQGDNPYCVPCSVLWLSNWFGATKSVPFDQFLSKCDIDPRGSKPSQVLDAARKLGIIPNYLYLRDPTNQLTLENALKVSPLMIGLWDWPLVPNQGHEMVLLDKTEDGSWLCVNWANPNRTDFVTLPSDTEFVSAVAFADLGGVTARLPFILGLIQKLLTFFT